MPDRGEATPAHSNVRRDAAPDDRVASALRDAAVVHLDGTAQTLGTYWRTGPAVLVFLRHFG
jgi:hypothetical protein